jgi:hypothetical protein
LENENEKDILLSEEDVEYVLNYAKSYIGIGQSYLSPAMINARMQDITLNPSQATSADLISALDNPKGSELKLQQFSQDFEIQSQIYKKLLEYQSNILAFDLTYECINAKYKDYGTAKYNKDLDILKEFLDKFDYKREFKIAVQEMIRNDAFFCCSRFDGNQYVLQELPNSVDYTMITGRWDYGLLFSLNMYWFMQPGVDLDFYPVFFKKKYNELFRGENKLAEYKPPVSPLLRGSSSYVYWQDIDVDTGWAWKMNASMATRLPLYSGLFLDLLEQPTMRELQKNINLAAASKIVIGEIPLMNKTSQASTRDQFSISAKNLGEFLGLVKAAIGSALKTVAVPLTNVKGISFDSENDLYSSYLRTTLASSGVNTNLLFTSEVKQNSIESQLALNVDENQMKAMYPDFEKFINYHVNKLTKNFKFKVHFEGTNFYNDREERLSNQMKLMAQGIVLPQKIAASLGMNSFEFQRQLDEARASEFVDNLTPIIPGAQLSGKEDIGRPEKSDGSLKSTDTRDSASNIEKGGKI